MKFNPPDSFQPYFIVSATVLLLFAAAIGLLIWRAPLVYANGDVSYSFTTSSNPASSNAIHADVSSYTITTSIGTAAMLLLATVGFSLLIVNGLVYVLARIQKTNG